MSQDKKTVAYWINNSEERCIDIHSDGEFYWEEVTGFTGSGIDTFLLTDVMRHRKLRKCLDESRRSVRGDLFRVMPEGTRDSNGDYDEVVDWVKARIAGEGVAPKPQTQAEAIRGIAAEEAKDDPPPTWYLSRVEDPGDWEVEVANQPAEPSTSYVHPDDKVTVRYRWKSARGATTHWGDEILGWLRERGDCIQEADFDQNGNMIGKIREVKE